MIVILSSGFCKLAYSFTNSQNKLLKKGVDFFFWFELGIGVYKLVKLISGPCVIYHTCDIFHRHMIESQVVLKMQIAA